MQEIFIGESDENIPTENSFSVPGIPVETNFDESEWVEIDIVDENEEPDSNVEPSNTFAAHNVMNDNYQDVQEVNTAYFVSCNSRYCETTSL